jgi:prevent-host-death family protein
MPELRDAPGYPSLGTGSTIATVSPVPEIPQKQLRNQIGEILRRAEAGEEFTITVSGRPVAKLGPIRSDRTWVDSSVLKELARYPVDENLAKDLKEFDIQLRDPWAEQD